MEKLGKDFWNKITLSSFILSILIVLMHNSAISNYNIETPAVQSISDTIAFLFHSTVSQIAVPMFFIISGFTFYRNFDMKKLTEKYKKRFFSLVIPYISWNTVYMLFAVVTSYSFLSKFFIGREKFVLSVPNVLGAIFFHQACNNHFWYVFDLILFTVLCPLIYQLMRNKYVGLITIAAAVAAYALIPAYPEWVGTLLYRTDSIIIYLVGVWLGMHGQKLFAGAYKKVWSVVGAVMVCCFVIYKYFNFENRLFDLIALFVACAGFWMFMDLFRNADIQKHALLKTSFFVYASHGLVTPIVCKLIYLVLPKNDWMAIVCYVLSAVAIVLICSFVGAFIHKHIKWLNKILSGSR